MKRSTVNTLRAFFITAALVPPVSAIGNPTDGDKLFDKHCAVCHQESGKAGIGLPLTTEKLATLSDNYLRKTIENGRPGRLMPPFKFELSVQEIDTLVDYLRKRSGIESVDFDPAPISGDPVAGKTLFEANCVTCHGVNGSGQEGGTGVTLSRERDFQVMPPAINNPGYQASADDQMIRETIANGRKGSIMPSFKQAGLSDTDINNLVAYVRTLPPTIPAQAEDAIEDPVYIIESDYDFETTVRNVKQALNGANFRVFPDRYLEQGMTDDANVNKKQIGLRFCNFNNLYDVLRMEPRAGIGLPCRITVMETDDGVLMITPNFRLMASWFNNDELQEIAIQMDQTVRDILDEAAL